MSAFHVVGAKCFQAINCGECLLHILFTTQNNRGAAFSIWQAHRNRKSQLVAQCAKQTGVTTLTNSRSHRRKSCVTDFYGMLGHRFTNSIDHWRSGPATEWRRVIQAACDAIRYGTPQDRPIVKPKLLWKCFPQQKESITVKFWRTSLC